MRVVTAKHANVWRALFLSDIHLATRLCRAAALTRFLQTTEAETLYLVGDIIDQSRFRPHWTDAQRDVLAALEAASLRIRIVTISGNHDSRAVGEHFQEEAIHVSATGCRLWVTHGDRFDRIARIGDVASKLGGWTCDGLQWASDRLDRRVLQRGRPAIAMARRLKRGMKQVTRYSERYAEALSAEAARRGFDGVISGHIHVPELARRNGVLYGNCGDWIDNCTAIGEQHDGTLVLLRAEHGVRTEATMAGPRNRASPTAAAVAA